ncbi:uncharacterized protein LOC116679405 [Etheostoma spectabile]|uniref:uncharacterized protein LOC116679405 n=1 Tax=Etheostoma spectabile TaxID=54343 RepID=UPI0013AEEA52|nr:uncharacterized protein LOC116679405 [Etheostoma spectabile]
MEDITSKLFDWKKDGGQVEVFLYDAQPAYHNGHSGQSDQFKGRVFHFPDELKHGNASITIRNTKISDSGDYRCDFPRLQPRQTFNIDLHVGSDVKVVVREDSDVVLPCSLRTKESIVTGFFDWIKDAQKPDGLKKVFLYDKGFHDNNGLVGQSEEFKGRVFHFQDELKHGNASIIIRNTKISDSGNYSCYFPRPQPPKTFYIDLVVGEYIY